MVLDVKKKNINIPNGITLLRLLLLIPLGYLILEEKLIYALFIYLLIILLDIIDGFLARRLKQETKFGDYFDSVVDSSIIVISLILLYVKDIIPFLILILLIVGRFLSFGAMISYYLRRRINYRPFYVKTGILTIHIVLVYIMIIPNFNIFFVISLIMYTYVVALISYVKIILDIYTKDTSKNKGK